MRLLANADLERSWVVANSRMNRERGAVGANSYEHDIGFSPIEFLESRLESKRQIAWLDLCCGRGRALIEAATNLGTKHPRAEIDFFGVDLIDMFEHGSRWPSVRFQAASLHKWETPYRFDLIACVHGLHYLGDKLGIIQEAARWLKNDGTFVANLDLSNLRREDGSTLGPSIKRRLLACGVEYNVRRHLLTCSGAKTIDLGYRYLGADDQAGPNYSGQEAVNSFYTGVAED